MSQVPLHIIVAMTASRVIGRDGRMPWNLPEDLSLFKSLTTGNTVIMGWRTFQSIGRPLSYRNNIIVSSTGKSVPGAEVFPDLAGAVRRAETLGRPAFFIGGARIYWEALPLSEFLHVSWVESEYEGDTYFPPLDLAKWQERDRRQYSGFSYIFYQRMEGDL